MIGLLHGALVVGAPADGRSGFDEDRAPRRIEPATAVADPRERGPLRDAPGKRLAPGAPAARATRLDVPDGRRVGAPGRFGLR